MLWRFFPDYTRRRSIACACGGTSFVAILPAPFPYIAMTAGWMTAEIGRQPWLVYGLLRTADGASPLVHSGNALFTLLGFLGIYLTLGLLFLFLIAQTIRHGPAGHSAQSEHA
jgi:cytochrome d ubiquinol oxidase subunit I